MQEGPEPLSECDQCGMHMQAAMLFKNIKSDKCHKLMERSLQQRDVEMADMCGKMEFSLDREKGD